MMRLLQSRVGAFFHSAFFFLCALFLLPSCTFMSGRGSPNGFLESPDSPIPDDVAVWLQEGEQTIPTHRILNMAKRISGRTRGHRVINAMNEVYRVFSYDLWLSSCQFTQTTGEIFEAREMGGCSDYALVQVTLFRALGIPSRMVMTANTAWMQRYRRDNRFITMGHTFIEAFLDDKWYLIDPAYRCIFSNYDPGSPYYPREQYFFRRGKDFWDVGIRTAEDLDEAMGKLAMDYTGDYKSPSYPQHPVPKPQD